MSTDRPTPEQVDDQLRARLAENIAAGRTPLTSELLSTIRNLAEHDFPIPGPRVLQLVDEVEQSRATRAAASDPDAVPARLDAAADALEARGAGLGSPLYQAAAELRLLLEADRAAVAAALDRPAGGEHRG